MGGFGLIDILLLAAAIWLVMMLRGSLGRDARQGRRPVMHPQPGAFGERPPAVVEMPSDQTGSIEPKALPVLAQMARQEKNFSPAQFLTGSEKAYAMLLKAFASSQRAVLENLLEKPVLASFLAAMEAREKAGERDEIKEIELQSADILEAELLPADEALITVRFRTRQISWRGDSEGRVVSGHPNLWRDIVDIWQFRRQLGSKDPTWRVRRTGSELVPENAS